MNSFGQVFSGFIFAQLETYTGAVYSALLGSWPAHAITTLYVTIAGYYVMMGHAGKHAKDLAISMVLLVFLGGIASSGFNEWVAQPVMDTVQGLCRLAISGTGGGTDVFQSLDDGLGQIMTTIDRIEPPGNIFTASWMYLKVGTVSLILSIAYCFLYVAFLVLYITAFFGIYMMLMVGGIFLWLGAFKATRQYTWAWLRAMFNYGLWAFFLCVVMGLCSRVITMGVHDLAHWDLAVQGAFPPSAAKLVFMCLLAAFLLLKAADFSASLTGGSAMSPGIVTSGANLVGSAVSSAAGSAPARTAGKFAAGQLGNLGRGALGGGIRAFSAMRGIK